MIDKPRILIITLYSWENEFNQLLESLKVQEYTNWEHKVFDHLPNMEAHNTLYREIMRCSKEFDLFIKLDADMVFKDSKALNIIVNLFHEREGLDHLQLAVQDWFSDSIIMGMHAYSNRVEWQYKEEYLFVDYSPSFPGIRWDLWDEPAPLVNHSPDPSPFQAFHFGLHRALKAFQPGRKRFKLSQARIQWEILKRVWAHFIRKGDRRLGLVLLGATYLIQRKVTQPKYDYTPSTLGDIFKSEFSQITTEELYRILRPYWGKPVVRELLFNLRTYLHCLNSKMLRIKDILFKKWPLTIKKS